MSTKSPRALAMGLAPKGGQVRGDGHAGRRAGRRGRAEGRSRAGRHETNVIGTWTRTFPTLRRALDGGKVRPQPTAVQGKNGRNPLAPAGIVGVRPPPSASPINAPPSRTKCPRLPVFRDARTAITISLAAGPASVPAPTDL